MIELIVKVQSLLKYLIFMCCSPPLKIVKIELNSKNNFIVYFSKFGDNVIYTASPNELFANTKLINKFSNSDAYKIGYYCAKNSIQNK